MRKLMSLALTLVMSLALAAPAAAADVGTSGSTGSVPVTISAEATTFNVTVPTSIPLNVDANAAVTCADNLKIINNSAGPVIVTDILITKGTWSIVKFNGGNRSPLASQKVNSNKLGLALTPDGGTQIYTNGPYDGSLSRDYLNVRYGEWVIPAGGNLPFECAGIATAVSESVLGVEAAMVIFTLAWKSIITFTIDDTSYQAENGMRWSDWINSEYSSSVQPCQCPSCGVTEYFGEHNFNATTSGSGIGWMAPNTGCEACIYTNEFGVSEKVSSGFRIIADANYTMRMACND